MSKLRVFGALNHLANSYEQLKLAKYYPVKFHYLDNNVRKWEDGAHRPNPSTWLTKDQFEWVPYYEKGKYDVAVLSVDQQHVNPDIGKGWLYRDLNNLIQDIPKIVINHGTPMYDEFYTEDLVINGGEVQTKDGPRHIMGMKEKIGDNFMIVNSYKSAERWGWGYPLIHGMDAEEWWDMPKEPRVVVALSPGGLDKYYNRQLLTYIKAHVREKCGLDVIHTNVNYTVESWDDYRELIGRSLINISPYLDSPMPRSRTEGMLSGACILTSRHHNADEFIEHGKEGFIMPDNPISYAETIYQLINFNYKETVEIGKRGKEKALKIFNGDRYRKDFYEILTKVADGKPPTQWEKLW